MRKTVPEVLSTPLQISVPLTAVKIGKFRPLPEPIRLQDLVHLARSRAEKKIKKNIILRFWHLKTETFDNALMWAESK